MQPTQALLQGIISRGWSLMRKKRGWREREKKMKERILYTVYQKRHSISTRRPCFDHIVLIWWTIAQRLQLIGPPSYPFCHRLQSNFCHQTFWQLFDSCTTCLCFRKPHHSKLAVSSWKCVPWLPLYFRTSPHNSFGKWSKLICHSWARALITY